MRRVVVFALLVVAMSACSVPKAETLNCGEDQSIFACKAKFSDGKARNIVFVKVPALGQTVLDEVTTRDDLGNEYCVTLYQNVTATYQAGACGAAVTGSGASAEPTATTLDSGAIPQGVVCVEGGPVEECRVSYSDGTIRDLRFVNQPSEELTKGDTDPHIDGNGVKYCVTLFTKGNDVEATYVASIDGC